MSAGDWLLLVFLFCLVFEPYRKIKNARLSESGRRNGELSRGTSDIRPGSSPLSEWARERSFRRAARAQTSYRNGRLP